MAEHPQKCLHRHSSVLFAGARAKDLFVPNIGLCTSDKKPIQDYVFCLQIQAAISLEVQAC